jgi:GR25 family glycosyltransferase involved in LPS biosynthesis
VRIFVISLPSARDRRAASAAEFARAGLEFEFFDAIELSGRLREPPDDRQHSGDGEAADEGMAR